MAPDPPGFFPPPLTIPPLTLPHKQTFILLHGRGSNPLTFGPDLLSTPFPLPSLSPSMSPNNYDTPPQCSTLRSTFPHAKFIFPHAPRQRATIYKRSLIPQWFDSWHLTPTTPQSPQNQSPTTAEEWRCIPGLQSTIAYLHRLIRTEADLLPSGTQSIILGGLSQGCAASLVSLMLWEGEKLAGYVGMCGWLPFAGDVKAVFNNEKGTDGDGDGDGDGEEGFDPFEREDGEGDGEEAVNVDVAARVVRVMREMLEMDGEGPTCCPRSFDIPVFLGHGDEDEKVPISRGREAAECLEGAGFDASWREYQGLGHWYSSEMLADMVGFLKNNTGWENGIKTS